MWRDSRRSPAFKSRFGASAASAPRPKYQSRSVRTRKRRRLRSARVSGPSRSSRSFGSARGLPARSPARAGGSASVSHPPAGPKCNRYGVGQVDVMAVGFPACQSTSFLLSHRTSGSDGCGLVSRKTAKSNAMTEPKNSRALPAPPAANGVERTGPPRPRPGQADQGLRSRCGRAAARRLSAWAWRVFGAWDCFDVTLA